MDNPPKPDRIMQLASAFYGSATLFATSDLGVFIALERCGETDLDTLVAYLDCDKRALRLLLDACVAQKLLEKNKNKYRNTAETSMYLVPGSPADLSKAIRYNRDVYQAWGKLPTFLETGEPVEPPEIHLGNDEDRTRSFVLSMHGRALGIGRAVIQQLQLDDCQQVLDMGGGPGTYSMLLAERYPDLTCTVLDLPDVVEIAAELIEERGLQDHVKTVAGSYHDAVLPHNQDAVMFFGVLHQESPDAIRKLFKRTWEVLNPGGSVYVLDMMTDATHTSPVFSAMFALNMALTTHHGWVFSDIELKGWMEEAGFTDFQCTSLPSPMPHWLAQAKKA